MILLVEDDETITFGVRTALERAGYPVTCCATLREARAQISPALQLALVDLNLPDGSGYDFCRDVRQAGELPVIFLTVRDDERDIVRGLDMGADDYIVKPFQLSVLLSRVRAVLRRARTVDEANGRLAVGGILLDPEATRVWADGAEIALSGGEYRLLLALMENKNRTLTRAALLERLWDIDGSFVNDNTLTVMMKRLRERLGNPGCIRTLRGIGYRMEDTP